MAPVVKAASASRKPQGAQAAFDALPLHVRDAVRDFRDRNGRTWKRALRDLWMSGRDTGALRTVRNVIGPSGLDGVRL